MKKLTIRVEAYVYDRLFLVAKENDTSTNKIVNAIVEKYINEPKEINYLKEVDNKLKTINDYLEKISKFGYLSNADINEDKCLNEILNNKDTFNE